MYPSGIIYNSKKSGSHGEVKLHATFMAKVLYGLLRGIGAGIIGFVIISFIFTFGPLFQQEVLYTTGSSSISYKLSQTDLINAQNTSVIQNEALNFGVNSYFSIVIPKIGAKANIIANVDSGNEAEYDKAL